MTWTELELADAPPQIHRLLRDADGTPVPWGIRIAGQQRADWNQIDQTSFDRAVAGRRCWTCGERLHRGSYSFVLSIRAALERTSLWPPSHASCASYIARHPLARIGPLALSPGAVLMVLQCREFSGVSDRKAKRMVFQPGTANDVYWIKDGRAATRAEASAEFDAADEDAYPGDSGLEEKARYEERRRILKRWLPE